jgi:hypothetical protein
MSIMSSSAPVLQPMACRQALGSALTVHHAPAALGRCRAGRLEGRGVLRLVRSVRLLGSDLAIRIFGVPGLIELVEFVTPVPTNNPIQRVEDLVVG